jgi:hypothetical protein
MNEVYEKYKHLDHLLSDKGWLPEGFMGAILWDLWQAVKAEQGSSSGQAECAGGEYFPCDEKADYCPARR